MQSSTSTRRFLMNSVLSSQHFLQRTVQLVRTRTVDEYKTHMYVPYFHNINRLRTGFPFLHVPCLYPTGLVTLCLLVGPSHERRHLGIDGERLLANAQKAEQNSPRFVSERDCRSRKNKITIPLRCVLVRAKDT